jgi:hypothetical protein
MASARSGGAGLRGVAAPGAHDPRSACRYLSPECLAEFASDAGVPCFDALVAN